MNDATREEVQGWLFKAKHDLVAARILGFKRSPLLDIAVYHRQQSAEKAVKGFLVYGAFTPPKSHNRGELTKLAAQFTPLYGSLTGATDRPPRRKPPTPS